MLIKNMNKIGNKLFEIRKKAGLTQAEVAEKAELSDRTYADIERGTSNMRAETLINICRALHITPDEIFVDNECSPDAQSSDLYERLNACTSAERETAFKLLDVYLRSLGK